MTDRQHLDRLGRGVIIAALVAALVFGVLVLAGGDWIPGTVIVVASAIGLARLTARAGTAGTRR